MKLVKSALAASILALASGQAIASTVDVTVNVSSSMAPEIVSTANSLKPPYDYNPIYVELLPSANPTTYFTLIDTHPEQNWVSYELWTDTDTSVGSYTLGTLKDSWTFTDLLGAGTLTHTYQLLAGTQYTLKVLTNEPNIGSNTQISAVPLPGAALLFGSVLLGAGALRRKQAKAGEMAAA